MQIRRQGKHMIMLSLPSIFMQEFRPRICVGVIQSELYRQNN